MDSFTVLLFPRIKITEPYVSSHHYHLLVNDPFPGKAAFISGFSLVFFIHFFWKRAFEDRWFLQARMSFLSLNKEDQSTQVKTKHWPQPVTWLHPFSTSRKCWVGHPFFIHHSWGKGWSYLYTRSPVPGTLLISSHLIKHKY